MQTLAETVRRNRSLIVLFTIMVVVPAAFLGTVGFRAIRSDFAQQEFQEKTRQRQIALLLESELKTWLFSKEREGASSQALLRFAIDGDRVVFPDFATSIPPGKPRQPVPVESPGQGLRDKKEIEEVYYPRIQVFLRDFKLNQNAGAQYFRRLRAMIVQIPGTPNGYILESPQLMEFSRRKLDEMTALENFRGIFLITEAGEPAAGDEETLSLNDFTFFHVAFRPKDTPGLNLRTNIVLYSTLFITIITVLGGLFLYRVVSSEMAVVRLRSEFVAAVSHEFRTPLSSMLVLLERLRSGHVSENGMAGRYHETLQHEARRLGLLVDKLLDFAQLEDGRKRMSPESGGLDEIAAEAVSTFHESSGAGHIEIAPSSLPPPRALVDRTAIVHCVQNLIENAVKYSPRGTSIAVHTGHQEDGAPFVEVIDQGIGISPSDQRKIFGKFYRADDARALNVQGTGIGLAIVKRIMELHGGSVTVVSSPGKGSRFRLVFRKRERDR